MQMSCILQPLGCQLRSDVHAIFSSGCVWMQAGASTGMSSLKPPNVKEQETGRRTCVHAFFMFSFILNVLSLIEHLYQDHSLFSSAACSWSALKFHCAWKRPVQLVKCLLPEAYLLLTLNNPTSTFLHTIAFTTFTTFLHYLPFIFLLEFASPLHRSEQRACWRESRKHLNW